MRALARRRPGGKGRRQLIALALLACLLGGWLALRPARSAAHPLGNFTVNHYSRLDFADGAVSLTYVLDFAEIPTFQLIQERRLDPDGDGILDPAEQAAYLDSALPALLDRLQLTVGGQPLPWTVRDRAAAFTPGQSGLPTFRAEARLRATLPWDWQVNGAAHYGDSNFPERIGWREIVVRGGAGIAIQGSSVPAEDLTDELRYYPQDMLVTPLDRTEATFTLAPTAGGSGDTAGLAAGRVGTSPRVNTTAPAPGIARLVRLDQPSPGVALLSLLAALLWGASHALSPGHGKTVVAAYLVGTRGTPRHAAFLGLTVTLTHTVGVFALGGITLALSRYLLPETLFPWLSLASGLLVVALGLGLASQRLRALRRSARDARRDLDHTHDDFEPLAHGVAHTHGGRAHTHLPPGTGGAGVTWRGLLALGVSGGLVPCPSALILLLAAISLGRTGFGLLLVLAFSAGLALVLTGIGLALVWARHLFARFSFEARLPAFLPVAGAVAITLAGAAIVYGALAQFGLP